MMRSLAVLAICLCVVTPLFGASSAELAMLFDSLGAIYDAARAVKEVEMKSGHLPKITSAAELARARFGDERAAEYWKDAWGTPLRIESAPGRGYSIIAAGSDKTFDRTSASKTAETRSTADDIVFRDGALVRSPLRWAEESAAPLTDRKAAERAVDIERHRKTVGDLRSIASGALVYEIDHNKKPAATSLEGLAQQLEPKYVGRFPRTDGWDRPYRVASDVATKSLLIVSAGPDGKFDPKSWTDASRPSDDIVLRNSDVVRNAEPPRDDEAVRLIEAMAGFRASRLRFEAVAR